MPFEGNEGTPDIYRSANVIHVYDVVTQRNVILEKKGISGALNDNVNQVSMTLTRIWLFLTLPAHRLVSVVIFSFFYTPEVRT